MRIEDKIIFNEIKQGNKVVYESLFAEYYEALVHFAEGYLYDQQESEDLVQDLFVYLWESVAKIEIHTSIKAYFYQAIRNKCLSHLKKLKLNDKKHYLYFEALMNTSDEEEFFDPQILSEIKESIEELPKQMSKVFKSQVLEGKKREEIAEEMGISLNTVKTHLQRAKDRLRKILYDKTNLIFFL